MPNLIEITEFSAPELDVYARLSEVQLRSRQDPSQALFVAESPSSSDARSTRAVCPCPP